MKFEIKLNTIKKYLRQTSQLVPMFSQLPEQSGLLIEVFETRINLRSANDYLKVEIETSNINDFNIIETGRILVKGRMLNDIVSKMNGEKVSFSQIDERLLIIKSEDSEYEVNLLDVERYNEEPVAFNSVQTAPIAIDSTEFKNMVSDVQVAVPEKSQRKILSGINIFNTENKINFVSTDGVRIARGILDFEGTSEFNSTINIKAIKELLKILEDNKKLNIKIENKDMYVSFDEITLKTRLLDDVYPDVSKIFSSEFVKTILVGKAEMIDMLERTTILNSNKQSTTSVIKLIIKGNDLRLESRELEVGYSNIKTNNFEFNSEDMFTISFNPRYLLEAVKHISDDKVEINLNSPETPFIITGSENKHVKHLILPFKTM